MNNSICQECGEISTFGVRWFAENEGKSEDDVKAAGQGVKDVPEPVLANGKLGE